MEKAQKSSEKAPSFVDRWFDKLLPWLAIVGTIAFFMGAASGSYDPSEVFPKIFGFVIMGSILIAVGALIVAIFNRLIGFLTGKK